MNKTIKAELHKLIDDCDNEALLQQAKTVLQSNNVKDWWDELTEEDNDDNSTPEKQYENGSLITDRLMQQFGGTK